MPILTQSELRRRDKALLRRCVDGLGLYAAQIAAENRHSSKIEELRKFIEDLIGYWYLDGAYGTKPDYLRAFDDRVDDAKTGGVVTGDVYQTSMNVISGLHLYAGEMAVIQGADTLGNIIDVRDLMNEIAKHWDFEPDVMDVLDAQVDAELRELLDATPLPGQAVNGEIVHGYAVLQAVLFDNDRGFALAHSPTAVNPFVTWQFTAGEEGAHDYYWGRYVNSVGRAQIDYITRAADYVNSHGVKENPIPTEKKPSTLQQIRDARNAPKPPRKPRDPDKRRGDFDR